MIEYITNIDIFLFRFLNSGIANPVFDIVMPFITNLKYWYPVYIILIVGLLWKGGKRGRICVLALLITITVSDQLSSSIIKELVGRLRPCHILSDVRLLVPCGGGKSFPSSHAVNNFAAAVVLFYYYRKYTWLYFSLAGLVAFSRIYVGVHYPMDVLGGAFIGSAVAVIMIYIIESMKKIIEKKYIKLHNKNIT
jgi:undecaprenyl-diphosphatase